MESWHCLRFIVPQTWAEDFSVHCFELGSCGLQIEEDGETTKLIAYFDAGLGVEHICRDLEQHLSALGLVETQIAAAQLEEQDWEAEWRSFFGPVWATPRMVVHPSWIPVEILKDQISLVIDPKMAFGTGGHESTQLCLQVLEDTLCTGDRCLDLGTGSGLLAIAAVRLGAAHVLAVDIDHRAVANARENAACNGIADTNLTVRQGSVDGLSGEYFELILANIQSHILRPMLCPIRALLQERGRAVFSGLLVREEQEFCAWVEEAGLQVDAVRARNNWICVVAQRLS